MALEPKPSILSVDNAAGRYALTKTLSREGFDVIEAATGADAMRLSRQQPDLIILDVHLPDMSGFEVCRQIKSDPQTAAIPVIHLSTTHISPGARAEGLDRGADGYMVHPVDPLEIVATVRAHLRIREAERALRASEERYRDLVENSRDLICTHDMEGRLLTVNATAVKMLGYPHETLLGMNLRDLLGPAGVDGFDAYLAEIRSNGCGSGLMEIRTAAGKVRYWRYDNTLRTEGLSVPIVRGTAHDVTDHTIAEAALRNSEAKFRSALENAAVGVALLKLDGHVIWVNETFCDMLGYTSDELTTSAWPLITHPDDVEMSREVVDALLAGTRKKSAPVEMRCIGKEGKVVWANVSTALVESGHSQPTFLITHVQDITRRKRADERIAHLNAVLRALRDINQLIVRENDSGRLLREAAQLLAIGRGYDCVLAILADKAGNPITHVAIGLEGHGVDELERNLRAGVLPPCFDESRRQPGVWRVRRLENTCVSCPQTADCAATKTMVIQLRHQDRVHGYLGVSVATGLDLDAEEESLFTEMASDLSYALDGIEQRKTALLAEQGHKRVEAELRQAQKMEAVGRLAGGVAHDFNNMLSVILGYAETALESVDPKDPLHADLQEIRIAGQRSADLTRQLLAFSRKQIVQPRVVSLNAVIADQQRLLGRLIGEDIEIRIAGDAEVWPVRVDPSQVTQILANLAVNARDAISGVGVIEIDTSNVTVDESLGLAHAPVAPGDYVMLRFTDTGSGMTSDVLEHAFEPFFTTKEEGRGTGLGLATVYGIVKQNNGAIQIDSAPGRGTTFYVYLPRYGGPPESLDADIQPTATSGSETVLIVEDEEQVLSLARRVLERRGYNVIAAATPGEAILFAETHPTTIDLLMTDVVMPAMNGKEVKERIAAIQPGMKALFISGYTADLIAHRGVLTTGDDFLQKPFSPAALASKVRAVLDAGP